jgi:hypothetical protein
MVCARPNSRSAACRFDNNQMETRSVPGVNHRWQWHWLLHTVFLSCPSLVEVVSLQKLSLRQEAAYKRNEHVTQNVYRFNYVGGDWLRSSFGAY